MKTITGGSQILAVYPFARGFAFVLFEGPESPFDWGVREVKVKRRNVKTVAQVRALINRYRPECIVLEEFKTRNPKRTSRIRKLYQMLTHMASAEYTDVAWIASKNIQSHFAQMGAATKYDRAQVIATQIPAFAHRMPRVRKAWMSADPRQSLFDAAALGLVYYGSQGIPSPYTDEVSN
jgi:hypothetical protein